MMGKKGTYPAIAPKKLPRYSIRFADGSFYMCASGRRRVTFARAKGAVDRIVDERKKHSANPLSDESRKWDGAVYAVSE